MTPDVLIHGNASRVTGLFGGDQRTDVLVNESGQVVQTGLGSIDACPTQDPVPGGGCLINP
jgi:hypothetical protein